MKIIHQDTNVTISENIEDGCVILISRHSRHHAAFAGAEPGSVEISICAADPSEEIETLIGRVTAKRDEYAAKPGFRASARKDMSEGWFLRQTKGRGHLAVTNRA